MLGSRPFKTLLLVSLILGSMAICSAATIVLPTNCPVGTDPGQGGGTCATTNGGDKLAPPSGGGRFQQSMDSSLFAALDTYGAGLRITGLALRPDPTNATASLNANVNLSMGLLASGLTSENMGSNMNNNFQTGTRVTVFNGSQVFSTSVVGGPPGTLSPFDYSIVLQTPFVYHPTSGTPLLFDAVVTPVVPTSSVITFDTVGSVAGDGVGVQIAASATGPLSNVGIANSTQKTGGFVVQFQYDVLTPEPSTFFLLGTGLAGVALVMRRRSRSLSK